MMRENNGRPTSPLPSLTRAMFRCALMNIAQAVRESMHLLRSDEPRGLQWMVDPITRQVVPNPLSLDGRYYERYVFFGQQVSATATPLPASTLTVRGADSTMTEEGAVSGQARVLMSPRAGETPPTPAAQDPILGVTRDPVNDLEVSGLAAGDEALSPLTMSAAPSTAVSPADLQASGPDATGSEDFSTVELHAAPLAGQGRGVPLTTVLEAQRAAPRHPEVERLSQEFTRQDATRRTRGREREILRALIREELRNQQADGRGSARNTVSI